ncbi:MAG TPA: wax ester/triacylglycerol synthase family O-acyltransferase [Burkholderiaceae bacterium]|nr:wax ester/triacylglycerol synthase family O-acyltransferase [Burkholderiaceae bacterium]
MSTRERMSAVDTAWLRMDSDRNLMMIVGVYEFDRKVDFGRLRDLLNSRLVAHRRFRSRVVRDVTGCHWEECDDFDLDDHLIRIALPGRGTEGDLKKLVGELASRPLDALKPLWQMHLIGNYAGGQALVVRIHHCIADGIALIGVLLALTRDQPDAASAPSSRTRRANGEGASRLRPLTAAAVKAIGTSSDIATKVLQGYGAILDTRGALADAALRYAGVATRVAKDAAAIALMPNDDSTSLKGTPSGAKVVAWNEPLALDDVKAVGRALGCSVNDVLLACMAGALRSYLTSRGERVDGFELRAMVPVNLRDPRHWKDLGNKFGLVPLLLPIGVENPIARVFEVRRRMEELKTGYTAVLSMGLLGAAGFAPRVLQKQALDFLTRKATAVMTNVPGPQQALYLAGAHVRRLMFWVPQSGDIGVGVSILSYDGGVQFGLITDRALCAHPQRVIDRFEPEFERLVLALCMLPWGQVVDAEQAQHWLFPASLKSRVESAAKAAANRSKSSARTR